MKSFIISAKIVIPYSNNSNLATRRSDYNYRCIFVGCSIFLWIVASTQGASITTTTETISYLTKLGYHSAPSRNFDKDLSANTWIQALRDKKFTGFNITGRLDDETMHFMTVPRCAAPGKFNGNPLSRSKRYVLDSERLKKIHLTYRIHNFPQSLPKDIVESEIARALDIWSKVSGLTFTPKKNGLADINISNHGDGSSFDGAGGILGHAYTPGDMDEGTVHFDAVENWTSRSEHGYNLFQVAVHEFGHTLGLDHSNVSTAVMWPAYKPYDPNFQLDEDDIRGIQQLYGISD